MAHAARTITDMSNDIGQTGALCAVIEKNTPPLLLFSAIYYAETYLSLTVPLLFCIQLVLKTNLMFALFKVSSKASL